MKKIIKSFFQKIGLYSFVEQYIWKNRIFLKVWLCSIRYKVLLYKFRHRRSKGKIRVLFIVSEIAKWKEQYLYELMDSSNDFFPIVGISAWNNQNELVITPAEYMAVQDRAEHFFDSLGDRHVRTVTIEDGEWRYHDLSEFKPDIVFYTEQWAPCPKQDPYEVSKYALTCFLPYYVPDFGIPLIDCYQQVERMSWTYFCLNEKWINLYYRYMRFMSCLTKYVSVGHPAIDYFVENRDRQPHKNYVIYAPHFSFPLPGREDSYTIGTFDWNGMQILEYAERHPEINWVLKPHPILCRRILAAKLMTKEELESYFKRWEKIAKVSTDSNYQELFLESRVMITDSGSFLPEYGSTGRPIIRMICSKDKHIPPDFMRQLYDTYYVVHNLDELQYALKLVLEDHLDPKLEARLAAVEAAGLLEGNSSQKITNYLLNALGRG